MLVWFGENPENNNMDDDFGGSENFRTPPYLFPSSSIKHPIMSKVEELLD